MIRHLFKLAWRRKKSGALLMLEIFISFLVVFGLSFVTAQVWSNYVAPVGYRWQEAWVVEVNVSREPESRAEGSEETLTALLQEVQRAPEVEAAGRTSSAPYQSSRMLNTHESEGRRISYELSWVTEGFAQAMGIAPIRGRWFEAGDTALDHRPVVIDERLAQDIFGAEDPIGRSIPRGGDSQEIEQRIIGVVPTYRNGGDLTAPPNYLFELTGGPDAHQEAMAGNIVLRVREGVDASFEERLTRRLQAIAPQWSIEMRPMAHMRDSYLRLSTAPLLIGGIVAVFLMLMVGLGLTGVLWQNVTQRTREMGLRRAAGATTVDVQRQVLLEILILATLGMAAGVVLVVQLPLLDLLGGFRGTSFGAGLAATIAIIYGLTALCALYPGRLATRMTPAEALHHD